MRYYLQFSLLQIFEHISLTLILCALPAFTSGVCPFTLLMAVADAWRVASQFLNGNSFRPENFSKAKGLNMFHN